MYSFALRLRGCRQALARKADFFGDFERLCKVFPTRHVIIQILFAFFIDIDTHEDPKTCAERNPAPQAVICADLDTGNELLLGPLCERGIDIHQSTYAISSHATLPHNAAYMRHLEVLEFLIASEADANRLHDFAFTCCRLWV